MTEDELTEAKCINNMESKFKFEKLEIWQKSMVFGEELNLMVETFPIKERFNLADQMRRAVDSIALNISEGAIGQSNPEQKRFIGYSIRSLAEVVTCLHKAKKREYIDIETFEKQYQEAFHLMNMLNAFKRSLI